jgi:hypothetical protein
MDRRVAAVTDATFSSLVASTLQLDVVPFALSAVGKSPHGNVLEADCPHSEAQFLEFIGLKDSVVVNNTVPAINAVVVINLMVTTAL